MVFEILIQSTGSVMTKLEKEILCLKGNNTICTRRKVWFSKKDLFLFFVISFLIIKITSR